MGGQIYLTYDNGKLLPLNDPDLSETQSVGSYKVEKITAKELRELKRKSKSVLEKKAIHYYEPGLFKKIK